MSNTTDIWASITDISCPFCRVGMLRWAEAGHVPGWRKCDTCGAQYLGDPMTGRLACKARGKRVTARRLAQVQAERDAALRMQEQRDIELATEAAARDLAGSYHGDGYRAVSTYAPESGGAYQRAYQETWRRGAESAVLDAVDSIRMPACASIVAISRDGARVVVYHQRRANGLFGGTAEIATDRLRAAIARGPRNSDELVALASAA